MSPIETALAIFALLITPGPTNTLLAVAGAERGWARAVQLIPAELTGYLATTVPLALLGARLLEALPVARTIVTVLAALWVLWLASALWRVPASSRGSLTVTAKRVFVTTLLNPKALIFGLVILPSAEGSRLAGNLGLFVGQVIGVAMTWAALGAMLHRREQAEPGLPASWRRAASLWLGLLGVYLLVRVIGWA